ncbi:MAG: PhnA domain-containing protein [Bacteroidota bacterium]
MAIREQLAERSGNKCELSGADGPLSVYKVQPQTVAKAENCIVISDTCLAQIENKEVLDKNLWRCLTSSMWSEVPAVQVVSWRMLNRLNTEDWAMDSLDMMYLDEETLAWAKAVTEDEPENAPEFHKDANGNLLEAGDSVVLTKTLDVKGSSLSAKLGTVVKHIRLVEDNTDQIEGKIEGQTIVILTKYVRKQSN